MDESAGQQRVLRFLSDPATHGGACVKRIETHGALVFLAGPYAYKVKRAVRFPFMDFSTLEKRRAACENEIAVNRAAAPAIYLGVVAITDEGDRLAFDGPGPVVEWAVRLRRFDEDATLDHVAAREGLGDDLIRQLAAAVVQSHRRAPVRDVGAVPAFATQAQSTLDELASHRLFPAQELARYQAWVGTALAQLQPLLQARARAGDVRRCHGDLHLRNIVLIDGRPVLFDAIEFSDAIATCDVLYDLAFLLMDVWERGHHAAANRILNRYLWLNEAVERQLDGLRALALFMSLRAAIRAKVLAALDDDAASAPAREALRYFRLALSFMETRAPRLLAVGGLSGTGKSTLAAALAPHLGLAPGAVHLRSDIERKRLTGADEQDALPPEAYAPQVSEQVFARLRTLAARALDAGMSVIVDAVHDRAADRQALAALAQQAGVRFDALWLEAPLALLQERVAARRGDASDATPDVVARQAAQGGDGAPWPALDARQLLEALLAQALQRIGDSAGADAEA